jgi:hypothetical protein
VFDTDSLVCGIIEQHSALEAIARVRGEFIDVVLRLSDFEDPVAISVKSTTGGAIDAMLESEVLAQVGLGIYELRKTHE